MNKKNRILSFCACALLLPALASAQSFGDLIRNAASQAAARVVTGKTEEAVTKALTTPPSAPAAAAPAAPAAEPQPAPAPAANSPAPAAAIAAAPAAKANCPKTRAKPLAALGPRPESYAPASLWPDESACPAYNFADYKFEAAAAQRKAFTDASKVSCNDCEGGYSYDAWAQHSLVKSGDMGNKFRDMLIALKVGETLNWKGAKYAGTIQATGAHPIGETPCRQYHWTLKDKNQRVVAERDGLYCELPGDYGSPTKYREIL